MKREVFEITPDNSVVAAILNDDTMIVDAISIEVIKPGSTVNLGHGYSDGTNNKCIYTLDDTIKNSGISETYSIYCKKNVSGVATVAIAGKPQTNGFETPGEIWFDFANYDASYTIIGLAIGH